jgi:hypothetical protein
MSAINCPIVTASSDYEDREFGGIMIAPPRHLILGLIM